MLAHDFKRYVGAQIGVFNPRGEKVGTAGHLRNTEYIYVVSDSPAALDRLRPLVAEVAALAESAASASPAPPASP